jgi:hypothetical protein
MFARSVPFCILLAAAACGPATEIDPDAIDDTESAEFALTLSANDAATLLKFVNYAGTTSALLDDQVALDTRAAQAVIVHRDGADKKPGGSDDDLFDSVGELDAVAYVGETALKRMLAWAKSHPLTGAETVEGVVFTADEAVAVIWGVNQATNDELNVGLQLDSRAVNGLFANRPFVAVSQMGAAPYVGVVALEKLRNNAPVWAAKKNATSLAGTFDGVSFDEATAKQALTLCNRATLQELLDGGLPIAGAAPIIGNRPYSTMAQVSAVSGVGSATMNALHKLAAANVPPLLVSFHNGTQLAIPDRNAWGASMGMTVTGMGATAQDVAVSLEIDHGNVAELRVVLTAPNGAQATVWEPGQGNPTRVVIGAALDRSGPVNGVWTLTVIDTAAGNVGTLNGWTLELSSK